MASDSDGAGNSRYFILALGLLVGFVIGFVMLLSRLPVDSSLSDYHPTQVLGNNKQGQRNYDFYTVLPDQADGNLPVQDVTPVPAPRLVPAPATASAPKSSPQAVVVQPDTRVVPGSVQNTAVQNQANEAYAEIPASSIGQQSYYLQAGSYSAAAEAERMRAAVLMLGFEAFIVKRQDASGVIGHRVRIGPFFDQNRLTEAKKRLRRGKVAYEIIRVTG